MSQHPRYNQVCDLRAQGKSFRQIGEALGMSRQNAWLIYKKRNSYERARVKTFPDRFYILFDGELVTLRGRY